KARPGYEVSAFLRGGNWAPSVDEAPRSATHRLLRAGQAQAPVAAPDKDSCATSERKVFMTNLFLREPFLEDLFDFRRAFDKIFNRMLTLKPRGKEEVAPWPLFNFVPPVEAYVDKEAKRYICKVSLPGIEPKEVQTHVQGNMLTIAGERKYTRESKEHEALHE